MENNSVNYYDENAETFFESTVHVDMSRQYQAFLKEIPAGGHILDLGCGAGRDSRHFLRQGYQVTAVDGSQKMCRMAADYIGQPVKQILFEDLGYIGEFDGIWACASLLHVAKNDMAHVIDKVYRALKPGGILYVSYKYGTEEREKGKRAFSDYTEEALAVLFPGKDGWKIQEWFLSGDVREERADEKWLNAVVKRM